VSERPEWLDPLLSALNSAESSVWVGAAADLDAVPDSARRSAVLILFGEGPKGPDLLLIERTAHLRSHAGQPAFPGGGVDPGDGGPARTAVREAQEETGLDPDGVEVLAVLAELWLPPSGNIVTPVVAWWREPSEVHAADTGEVAAVARVPVADLADPRNRSMVRGPSGRQSPAFAVADMLVWGFTAGVLDRLLALGGWEQPWDRDRVIDLPPHLQALALRSGARASDASPRVVRGGR
jgi:8-oxo-dGTP pyrophosphatase MutT (NUDIX family)